MEELMQALEIFSQYDNPKYPTHCEHDVLRVFIDPDDVSVGDKEKLEGLGFIEDKEFDCFLSYRYGSC